MFSLNFQKIMWKLNKSIAKELLPTQPVDFPIESWWGVCLVNFTLEEFKVRSELPLLNGDGFTFNNVVHCVNMAMRSNFGIPLSNDFCYFLSCPFPL